MSWNFNDLVKGQVSQSILQSVLERLGYRVYRFGIEEQLPELRGAEETAFRKNLPERLRFLPDLLVVDPGAGTVHLAEVKFRGCLSERSLSGVFAEVMQRRAFWPEAHTVLMIATPQQESRRHQDYMRVITPEIDEGQVLSRQPLWTWWDSLPQLQEVFRLAFGSFDQQQIIDSVTPALRELAKLEKPLTLAEVVRRRPCSDLT